MLLLQLSWKVLPSSLLIFANTYFFAIQYTKSMNEVVVLKEGYCISDGPGRQKACGTITLIKGPKTVIVDTGNPWDKNLILQGLEKSGLKPEDINFVVCTNGHSDKVGLLEHKLTPEQIEYVVCTHGHSDHVGNTNLFSNAIHVMGYDICIGDLFISHEFKQGIPYEIDDNIEVVPTPGHTGSDVSVIVRNTPNGIVIITGDLFESYDDLEDPEIWQQNSEYPELQEQNRINVLKIADEIVPGHGARFKVPEECKKQMKVVMFYEEYSSVSHGAGAKPHIETKSEYVVVEEDL